MHILWRGDILQRLRLVSGLILFSFATTHFLNHALGLVSLDWMQTVQQWRWAVTRSWPGTIVLLERARHPHLARRSTSSRAARRCGCRAGSSCSSLLGLPIPFLLFPHIVNTRIAHVFFGVNDIYIYELARLWPASAIVQSLLLVIVWVHGCIGIHFWLRLYAAVPARASRSSLRSPSSFRSPRSAGFIVAGSSVASAIEVPRVFDRLEERHAVAERHRDRYARLAADARAHRVRRRCWPWSSPASRWAYFAQVRARR